MQSVTYFPEDDIHALFTADRGEEPKSLDAECPITGAKLHLTHSHFMSHFRVRIETPGVEALQFDVPNFETSPASEQAQRLNGYVNTIMAGFSVQHPKLDAKTAAWAAKDETWRVEARNDCARYEGYLRYEGFDADVARRIALHITTEKWKPQLQREADRHQHLLCEVFNLTGDDRPAPDTNDKPSLSEQDQVFYDAIFERLTEAGYSKDVAEKQAQAALAGDRDLYSTNLEGSRFSDEGKINIAHLLNGLSQCTHALLDGTWRIESLARDDIELGADDFSVEMVVNLIAEAETSMATFPGELAKVKAAIKADLQASRDATHTYDGAEEAAYAAELSRLQEGYYEAGYSSDIASILASAEIDGDEERVERIKRENPLPDLDTPFQREP